MHARSSRMRCTQSECVQCVRGGVLRGSLLLLLLSLLLCCPTARLQAASYSARRQVAPPFHGRVSTRVAAAALVHGGLVALRQPAALTLERRQCQRRRPFPQNLLLWGQGECGVVNTQHTYTHTASSACVRALSDE